MLLASGISGACTPSLNGLFGLLHDVSDGWTIPFAMFLVVYVVQIAAGAAAGRSRFV